MSAQDWKPGQKIGDYAMSANGPSIGVARAAYPGEIEDPSIPWAIPPKGSGKGGGKGSGKGGGK